MSKLIVKMIIIIISFKFNSLFIYNIMIVIFSDKLTI